jgi:integrase
MGPLPTRGGVRAKGKGRVQFDFNFHGTRYRPTIAAEPTEANLQRARAKLRRIKVRIAAGTFSFNEEFPAYRYKHRLARPFGHQTCNDVFDAYLAHCAARLAKFDLAYATLASYRRAIDSTWRPAIGSRRFDQVNYSMLVKIADAKRVGKKTYNNIVSVLRRAFEYGYRDYPERQIPARGLKTLRMRKKDRPPVDPFSIDEAEALITAIHQDWGQAQGNYDEFRFFTGLRPSEQVALLVSDCDLAKGTIAITKARVMARDKDRTKTSEDRTVQLCSRASDVLKRQLALRERWQRLGTRIDDEHVFFKDDGEPIRHLHYGWKRWRHSIERLGLRLRAPYKARHSFITWNLMLGKNPLWVAKQHGHSAHLMLDVYANWIEGTDPSQIAAIEQAMQRSAAIWHQHGTSAARTTQALRSTGKYVAEREGFEFRAPVQSASW